MIAISAAITAAIASQTPPDLNGDGFVDAADQGLLFGAWGWQREPLTDFTHPADINDDGRVDGADYGLLIGAWGWARHDTGDGAYWPTTGPAQPSPYPGHERRAVAGTTQPAFIDRRLP